SQTVYTQLWKNDDNVLRVPEWFANAQLTYEKFLFARALQMQLGIELCYRSAYQALGYAPDIQTFYNQDSKTISDLVVGDIFMNAKIKRGRLFVKYHNYTRLFRPPGYMLTYGYPAVPNVIDFGFELLLFD
ncbi:MAG: putative porin, partial [Flammeovirgaceae bacterium]